MTAPAAVRQVGKRARLDLGAGDAREHLGAGVRLESRAHLARVKEAAAFVEFFQRHLKEYGLAARNIVNSRSANEAILNESPHLRTFVELPVVPAPG